MNKREFFDAITDFKLKHMSLDFLQDGKLKELLYKNVEQLSEKDARSMLARLLYQMTRGTHFIQMMDEFVREFNTDSLDK